MGARIFPLLLAGAMFPAAAAAQPADSGVRSAVRKAIAIFQRPVHPIVGSVAPRGWVGAGLGYNTNELWEEGGFASVEGLYTIHRYWSTHGTLGLQGNAYRIEAYGRIRDMKRLDFYGLGHDSSRDDRATFRLQEGASGGLGSVRRGPLAVGGRLESIWPDLKPGEAPDHPSFEQRFAIAGSVPAPGSQPRFTHYQAFANINYPSDLNARGWTGGDYRIAFSHYGDAESKRHSFRRISTEGQQRIPGFRDNQRLTLHALAATTYVKAGHSVPFYLQETLGGAGAVRGFHDDIIGTDGTKATLRGFDDLRFRGPHLILLQAEYRFGIWGPLDGTVFVDAGKVTADRRDLDLSDLKRDYGFSVSLMTGDATAVRVDFGFGGGEGARVFFGIGPIFAQ